jgi:molybdopterin-guanine dinucleotide biosynthesis protein A
VLAGGRSRRFGSDKLIADLGGAPLLHHALRAAAAVVDEIFIVVARTGSLPPLPEDLARPIGVVRDDAEDPGPLAGLLAGARAARGGRLLVVAGDMPMLRPALLARLLAWHRGDGACLTVDGERQFLPLGVDRGRAIVEADARLTEGERSLRALISRLDLEAIPEDDWRALDPDGRSLRDVDRPEDLASLG